MSSSDKGPQWFSHPHEESILIIPILIKNHLDIVIASAHLSVPVCCTVSLSAVRFSTKFVE